MNLLFKKIIPLSLIIFLITRIALIILSTKIDNIVISLSELFSIIAIGFVNDIATITYFLSFCLFIYLLFPNSSQPLYLKIRNFLSHLFFFFITIIMMFNIFAEMLFWEEFSSRFNFIAVDYLIYTHEVIGNIIESYNLPLIIISILFLSIFINLAFIKIKNNLIFPNIKKRFVLFISVLIITITQHYLYNSHYSNISSNRIINELNKNGIYSLFSAFKNNILNFNDFYAKIDIDQAYKIVKKDLLQSNQNYSNNSHNTINRNVKYDGKPKKYNVILISVESLSKEYIGKIFEGQNITPFLSKIKKESIDVQNFYATGTRTVRGLEALTLGIPPTPGSSIVRRQNNENLFSIASVLTKHNYDLKFIYGGFGYFDNMNYFFKNNNFNIVDRNNINKEDITFTNIWGVADEDLYNQALREADLSFHNSMPFYQHIMTTSNHRPYTFPDNKINLASGSGRYAAVKYTDYALKEFINQASKKQWFDNTIFIITADHCASSAGKTNIPFEKYHIPLYIYSPSNITPAEINTYASQIDLPPTILALLNISYESRFFGNDLLTKKNDNLFMGTYQLLGFYSNEHFTILQPQQKTENYYTKDMLSRVLQSFPSKEEQEKAVSYYQVAYDMFINNKLKND